MYKKNIKSFFPTGSRNIILVVLVIGIGAIFYGLNKDTSITILGLLVFLISIIILTGNYGVEVDFDKKYYRSYLSFIFVLKFGKWKPLPSIHKISLTPEKHFVSRHSLQGNIYTEVFLIKLIGNDTDESIIVSRGLYGELTLEAEDLSKKLKVPVKEF